MAQQIFNFLIELAAAVDKVLLIGIEELLHPAQTNDQGEHRSNRQASKNTIESKVQQVGRPCERHRKNNASKHGEDGGARGVVNGVEGRVHHHHRPVGPIANRNHLKVDGDVFLNNGIF